MSKKEHEKQKKECCRENECCNEHKCECECSCEPEKNEYLEMAQRIQAEFDNYRKRSNDIVKVSRQDGIIDAVLRFLPAIDAIGKAKQMITDPKTLEGINLIEKEFKNSLKALNIEEIEAQGKVFDPKFHNVIAVKYDNSLGDSVITDVYQAGYKIGDRVLRYSQVIVNKVKENN